MSFADDSSSNISRLPVLFRACQEYVFAYEKETGREKEICKKFYRIGPGIKITIYSVDFFSSVYRVSVKGKKPVNPKPTKVVQNSPAAVEP